MISSCDWKGEGTDGVRRTWAGAPQSPRGPLCRHPAALQSPTSRGFSGTFPPGGASCPPQPPAPALQRGQLPGGSGPAGRRSLDSQKDLPRAVSLARALRTAEPRPPLRAGIQFPPNPLGCEGRRGGPPGRPGGVGGGRGRRAGRVQATRCSPSCALASVLRHVPAPFPVPTSEAPRAVTCSDGDPGARWGSVLCGGWQWGLRTRGSTLLCAPRPFALGNFFAFRSVASQGPE